MSGNGRYATAARLHAHGEPLQVERVELADPGPDDLWVDLEFAGVNPVDRYNAEGRVAPDGPLPRTLGGEATGTAEGDRVLVAGEGLGATRDGVWAQAAVVPRSAVQEVPEGVPLEQAAAMGIAGLTAWNCVCELAAVSQEDRVLVLGAAGGVGSMIVSLVSALGATVWGHVGTADKQKLVEAQGAQRVLVGEAPELSGALSELEPTVVFDPLGGAFVDAAVGALAARGRLVSFGTSAGPKVSFNLQNLYRKMARILGYGGMLLNRDERREGLRHALEAVRDGRMQVPIDDVLPLTDVREAFERLEQRRVSGKLLLRLE